MSGNRIRVQLRDMEKGCWTGIPTDMRENSLKVTKNAELTYQVLATYMYHVQRSTKDQSKYSRSTGRGNDDTHDSVREQQNIIAKISSRMIRVDNRVGLLTVLHS